MVIGTAMESRPMALSLVIATIARFRRMTLLSSASCGLAASTLSTTKPYRLGVTTLKTAVGAGSTPVKSGFKNLPRTFYFSTEACVYARTARQS